MREAIAPGIETLRMRQCTRRPPRVAHQTARLDNVWDVADTGVFPMRTLPGRSNLRDMLTVTEAAEYLGVSASTLRNWDRSGKLPAARHPVNSYRLYRKADLDTILNALGAVEVDR